MRRSLRALRAAGSRRGVAGESTWSDIVRASGERTVVLLRHGESAWNLEKRFTGWSDPPLTARGEAEAVAARDALAASTPPIDVVFVSELSRARRTGELALPRNNAHSTPQVFVDWRLNERHYGALQGLRKDDPALIARHGLAAVAEWRRGFDSVPPLADADCASVRHGIRGESVRMCGDRVVACWTERIAPLVRQGANVLVVAHANSMRALISTIDDISAENMRMINVPNRRERDSTPRRFPPPTPSPWSRTTCAPPLVVIYPIHTRAACRSCTGSPSRATAAASAG